MSSVSALNSLLSSSSTDTSSIDISNILAAMVGAQTPGIDVSSAVSSVIYADRAPERVWQSEQTTLSSQASALQSIESATSSVQTDLQSLNSLSGPLSARDVTSSDSSAVTATAASGTTTGSHQITVSNLATTGSWYSSEASSATASLASGSFTITTASGATATITTGSGGDATLNAVASDINSQSLGVTASVVTDASGSRLSLVSNSSGSAADFSVTAGTGSTLSFTQAQQGLNASLTVDGVPVSSASNTVTGAISGVTLQLLSPVASTTPVDLSVQTDTSQISSAINQFVSDYNSAIGLLNAQFTFSTSSSSEGPLASDSTVRSLQEALMGIASYSGSGSGSVQSLNGLGITLNEDGTLSVDSTTLNSVLANDPTDVQNFLQGSALNGFASIAANQMDSFTDPSEGAFTVDLNSLNAQNTDLTNQINDFETNYIAQQQTQLTTEYTNAEEALQTLPTQMAQIQDELGNNSNSNSNG